MNTSTGPRLTSLDTASFGRLPEKPKRFRPMGEVVEGRDKRDKILQSGGR